MILTAFSLTACFGISDPASLNADDSSDSETSPETSPATHATIYIGTQKTSSISALFKFRLNISDNTISFVDSVDLTAFGDDNIRSTFLYNQVIYAGGRNSGSAAFIPVNHSNFSLGSLEDVSAAASVRGIAHGMCFLSNGNFIIGGYNQEFTEYSSSNNSIATSDTSGAIDINSMTRCFEGDNTSELYFIDYDGNSDSDGDIVYATKSGSDWSEVSRYDLSSNGGGSLYAMVKHTDGNLYAFPQNLGLAAKNIIQCDSVSTNKLGSCNATSGDTIGSGIVQTAVQIPDSNDMIYIDATSSSNVRLYRVNTTSFTRTFIAELSGIGLIVRNQFGVRGMEIIAE
ncbi:MAG: hypothetical protein VX642_11205 [Bdellovibrionota bacterium]|nr:hypothetical protein [Bdellovibrionota bacterium]